MTTIPARLTGAALDALTEGDGKRYERIEGDLQVMTQPTLEHQLVSEVPSRGARNEQRDRERNLARNAFQGMREEWLLSRVARVVQVDRSVGPCHTLVATGALVETLTAPLLPGFACHVAARCVDLPPTGQEATADA